MSSVNFERDVHCILGLPFDAIDLAETLRRVRSAASGGTRCILCTPNLNFLVNCLVDADFRDSVIGGDLSIADGMPVVWIARLLGAPIRVRVAGSTLLQKLQQAEGPPISIFFFGGPEGAAASACERIGNGGGLVCAGFEYPGFRSVEELSTVETISRINASGARMLAVSLGAKKGHAWIERNRTSLAVPLISHLGAALNFVAGSLSRAPAWMQDSGLEWLWRVKEEPVLWRRYLRDGLVFAGLLLTRIAPLAWLLRWNRPRPRELQAAGVEANEMAGETILRLRGAWTRKNLHPLRAQFARAAARAVAVRVDVSQASFLDTAVLGLLLLLYAAQKSERQPFACDPSNPRIARIFLYSGCEFLLTPAPRKNDVAA
jgi:N-acetylglucosaminyldiphosphoundecaprenol N-acetyl-beta-D-mannosaminyltransferase